MSEPTPMSVSEISQDWMNGTLREKVYYSPADWMKGTWNGDFFYELSKLNDFACLKFCMHVGLVTNKYECPNCGDEMKLTDVGSRWSWVCRKSGTEGHYIKRSLRNGTWFQKSNLKLGVILRLVYMWVNKIPLESIVNDLGVASETAAAWRNFCREICMDYCLRLDGQVGGSERIVDIYEAWLSPKKFKIERRARGPGVFVGLVRNLNDFFVEVVEDRSAEVLVEVIIKRVCTGSTIVISCGELYNSNPEVFEQLEAMHQVKITNTYKSSDGLWSKAKNILQGNDFVDGEFNEELAEYIWRRRNNYVITQKVQNFFKAVSKSFPLKSKD